MQTENLKLKLYENDTVINFLSDMNALISSLDTAVGNLVKIMSKVESDTTSNTSAIDVLEGAIALTNKMLDEVESSGTSTDVRLNDAITENVNKISVLTTQLNALKTSSDSSIEEIHGSVSQLDGQLTALNNVVTALSTSVDNKNNQQDMTIAGNSSNITTLNGRVSTNEDAIQMLESDVQEINSEITSISGLRNSIAAVRESLDSITADFNNNFTKIFSGNESETYDSFDLETLPSSGSSTSMYTVVLRLSVDIVENKNIIPLYFTLHEDRLPASINNAVFKTNSAIPKNFYNVVGIKKNLERDCFYVYIAVNGNIAFGGQPTITNEYIDFYYKIVEH